MESKDIQKYLKENLKENWKKGAILGLILGMFLQYASLTQNSIGLKGGYLSAAILGLIAGVFVALSYDTLKAIQTGKLTSKTVSTEYSRLTLFMLVFGMLILNSYVTAVIPLNLDMPFAISSTGSIRANVNANGASFYCCLTGWQIDKCSSSTTANYCDFNDLPTSGSPYRVTVYCTTNPQVFQRSDTVQLFGGMTSYVPSYGQSFTLNCGTGGTPGCQPNHASQDCYLGNAYWFDNCKRPTDMLGNCVAQGKTCHTDFQAGAKVAYCTGTAPTPAPTVPERVCQGGTVEYDVQACSGSQYTVAKQMCTDAGQWLQSTEYVICPSGGKCDSTQIGSGFDSTNAIVITCRGAAPSPTTTQPRPSPTTTQPTTTPTNPPNQHLACVNQKCQLIQGNGENTCHIDGDCIALPNPPTTTTTTIKSGGGTQPQAPSTTQLLILGIVVAAMVIYALYHEKINVIINNLKQGYKKEGGAKK
jgi:hypothetical protein